jgi:hypothetical protein
VAAGVSGELTRERRGQEGRWSGLSRGCGDRAQSVPAHALAATKERVESGPPTWGIDDLGDAVVGGRRGEAHDTSLPFSLKVSEN